MDDDATAAVRLAPWPARGTATAGWPYRPGMSFLRTPTESPLSAAPAESLGSGPHYTKVFALVPDAHRAWPALGEAVRAGLPELRYELVTVATARRLRSAGPDLVYEPLADTVPR